MTGGLRVDRVTVRYDDLEAVRDVSLAVDKGDVLAVLGPSGCGKSTLLRAIAGLEPLSGGDISFDGASLAGVPTHRRGFALMFQDGQLFSHLTVAGNIGYPLRLRRTPKPEAARRIAELLELVGLSGYADREPATLSGGERQRVALARALAVEPRLLLLDEPLSALDGGLRERLAAELRDILRRTGTTAVFVTHDHEEAFAMADRLAVMRGGRLIQDGPIADVWQHPADADTALFLGYARVLTGPAAETLLAASQLAQGGTPRPGFGLALRRSALAVSSVGSLPGVVRSARATPEQIRLVVDVESVGELDAVAALTPGPGVPAPTIGAEVLLAVDSTRLALVPPSLD